MLSYLKEHNAMTLATLSEGQPWAAAVFYVHDDRLNLYFLSDPK
ncbi:MAG: pyridoxamine 5'-phosphate oxidase family protein, partial [Dehalococcoidia bacterium]|nr:pyridoxamine 5'-phosphate oxidase family protein [Dehalococcoidia bacterium]